MDEPSTSTACTVEDVLVTDQFDLRDPGTATDDRQLTAALLRLTRDMATDPGAALLKLADAVYELCKADSAGISVADVDASGEVFRWAAVTGEMRRYVGHVMPRHFSPCGEVVTTSCC